MQIIKQELNDFVVTVVSDLCCLDRAEVRTNDRLREDLGLDSLQSMELLSRVSEKYDIDPELEDAADVSTISDVVTFVGTYLQ